MSINNAIDQCAKWVNVLIEEKKKNETLLLKIDDLLIKVVIEAHTMGRIYNKMGEPENPAGYMNQLKKMVERFKTL